MPSFSRHKPSVAFLKSVSICLCNEYTTLATGSFINVWELSQINHLQSGVVKLSQTRKIYLLCVCPIYHLTIIFFAKPGNFIYPEYKLFCSHDQAGRRAHIRVWEKKQNTDSHNTIKEKQPTLFLSKMYELNFWNVHGIMNTSGLLQSNFARDLK